MTTASLRFGSVSAEFSKSSDKDFLAALSWRQADSTAQGAERRSDLMTVGLCWKQQCLKQRRANAVGRFTTLDRVLAGQHGELPDEILAARTPSGSRSRGKLRTVLASEIQDGLQQWLAAPHRAEQPLVLLAAVELLWFQADRLSAQLVGQLWRWTLSAAIELAEQLEATSDDDSLPLIDAPDAVQTAIVSGLLPYLCGLLFDDVKGAPKLAKAGRKALNAQLVAATDDNGLPLAAALRCWPEWLSLWTDALVGADRFEGSLWKDSAKSRFVNCLQATASLLSPSGRFAAADSATNDDAALLYQAGQLAGVKSDAAWFALVGRVAGVGSKGLSSKAEAKKAMTAGWQSDASRVACFRTSWSSKASILTVTHDQPTMTIELVAGGEPILRGDWGLEVLNNGQKLEVTTAWDCVCWYTDRDLDYAEWLVEVAGGVKVARYAMLSRQKQFVILADVVTQAAVERVDVASHLPLVSTAQLKSIPDTRELEVVGQEQLLRVFPLILPQDPGLGTINRAGATHDGRCLSVSGAATGGGIFSPVVFDWSPKRRDVGSEWRSLTISEAGVVDSTAGRGFRLLAGSQHLVLFRGLRPTTRYRTVLGYQTWNETAIINVTKDGTFEEVLLVEQ